MNWYYNVDRYREMNDFILINKNKSLSWLMFVGETCFVLRINVYKNKQKWLFLIFADVVI